MATNNNALALALRCHKLYHAQLQVQYSEEADYIIETEDLSDDEKLSKRLLWQARQLRLVIAHIKQLVMLQLPFRGEETTLNTLNAQNKQYRARLNQCNVDIRAAREAACEHRKTLGLSKGAANRARKQTHTEALSIQEKCQGEILWRMEQLHRTLHDEYWHDRLEKVCCGRH